MCFNVTMFDTYMLYKSIKKRFIKTYFKYCVFLKELEYKNGQLAEFALKQLHQGPPKN